MLHKENSLLKSLPIYLFSIGLVLRSSGGSVSFISPVLLVLVGLVFSLVLLKKDYSSITPSVKDIVPIIFFIGFCYISLMYSKSPNYGVSKTSLMFFWIVVFILISPILIRKFGTFLESILVAQVILIISLYLYFGSPFDLLRTVNQFFRLGDESTNPITFSRILGVTILFNIFYLRLNVFKNKFNRSLVMFLSIVIISIGLMYMFFSGSKGPILSLAIALFTYFIVMFRLSAKSIGILIALMLVVFSVISYFGSNSFILDFIAFRFTDSDASFSSREVRMFGALEKYFSSDTSVFNLLFGFGIGNFSNFFDNSDSTSYPHNLFVEVVYELGFFGLILFLYSFIRPVFWSIKSFKKPYVLEIFSLFVYLFINSMVSGDLSTNFFLMGSTIILMFLKKEKYVL